MKRLLEKNKNHLRQLRHDRIRPVLKGTASRPRLSVFRSLKGMIAQIIDDSSGKTLVYASSADVKKKDKKTAVSFELGKLLAEKAIEKKIKEVKFDRGGYKYHGRIKALADGAREAGLVF